MNRRTIMLIGATLLDFLITASHAAFAQVDSPPYDLVIRHGAVYDGTGAGAVIQDIAVEGDRIAALGDLSRATGRQEVDATGLAVAPGRNQAGAELSVERWWGGPLSVRRPRARSTMQGKPRGNEIVECGFVAQIKVPKPVAVVG